MRFRVRRREWGTGENGGFLYSRNNKKKCCLGFACEQVGVSRTDMSGLGMPGTLYNNVSPAVQQALVDAGLVELEQNIAGAYVSSAFCHDAVNINDDVNITNKEREKRLRKLARQHGHIFAFE